MWLKYLRILGILCLGTSTLCAQSGEISGDLSNLYELTLANSPTVKRQQIQNRIAEAARQTAKSQFDYQLASDASISRAGFNLLNADPRRAFAGSEINTNDFLLSAGIQRTFRTGTIANFSLNYQRVADSNPLTIFNENVGAFVADNSTGMSFSITQPLLRGQGREIVTANESLAKLAWESQQENAVFVTAGQLLSTVNAYWQYRSASESYVVYQDNENRVRSVLEITEELVAADKKPTGDLTQIRADLKDKERQTILAAQNLFAARQNLGRSLGLETIASESIGDPVSTFPSVNDQAELPGLESLINLARQKRADIKSIKLLLDQQTLQLKVAENNLKPQVNVTAFANYGGTAMGNGVDRFFNALANNEGRNYQTGIGLGYLFPLNNNFAQAAQLNAQLQFADQETFLRDQIRNIELNVSIAYNNYINSVEAVRKSKQSLDYYEEVFTNEQYKFQNGLTTLLNLILLQERLTFAQLDYIQTQQRFAIAISNLHYETGTLYDGTALDTAEEGPVDISIFYSLPEAQ